MIVLDELDLRIILYLVVSVWPCIKFNYTLDDVTNTNTNH